MKKNLDESIFANTQKNAFIKFLIIIAGVLLAFTMSITAQTTFPSGCNSIQKTSGGSTVQFIGVTYSGTGVNIKSTYTYKITSGCSPNISHFDFGGLNCPSCMSSPSDFFSVSASGTYSFGTDPNTGICGIKYDYEISCNSSNTVSFTLNGYYGVGTIKFALKAGQNLEYADICGPDCTRPILSLGDFVWYDINNNGIQDSGETGISGASVNLYLDDNADNIPDGSAVQTVTTNSAGLYNFTNLLPGNYIVGVTIPSGYVPSAITATSATPNNDINTDNNGIITVAGELRSNFITITTYGEPTTDGDGSNGNLTLDFGLRGTGSIGDRVFNDANGNGLQDVGELGIAGVTVTVTNTVNGVSATTTTDANGAYSFPNLAPSSNYTVTFNTPLGFTATTPHVGTDITIDSDPTASVTGATSTVTGITVAAGLANTTVDAGFYQAVSLGNTVFYDQNNNGLKDGLEIGLSGVTVNLYTRAGLFIRSTTTGAGGLYSFTGLIPGSYIVGVILPSGYAQGSVGSTTPDNNIDNDNNGVTTIGTEVRSNAITLVSGTEPDGTGASNTNTNNTLDFGLRGTGSIGDRVFNDANRNGLQDAGELGIAGVTVTVTNTVNGVSATTTTDANGAYSFPNLAPSSNYTVTFNTPSGFTATTPHVGTDITIDSDPTASITGTTSTVTGVTVIAGVPNNTIDAGFFITKIMISISGNVWHDVNGLLNGTINNTPGAVPIPSGLNVYLINNATGKIEQSNIVANNGVFTFLNVNINTSYRILYSTIFSFPGDNAPNVLLPAGWFKVGENLGAGPGTDGVIDGILFIQTAAQNIINANFGIQVKLGEVVIG